MSFVIREATESDLDALLALYTHLHSEEPPEPPSVQRAWSAIMADANHHIFLVVEDGVPVSSCVLLIVPNLTRGARPYGLIENVVTHPDFRGGGRATALLKACISMATQADCYKVMLLTGRKDEATLRFYQHAGFHSEDKTAFIYWI